jgi:hypothetical protein
MIKMYIKFVLFRHTTNTQVAVIFMVNFKIHMAQFGKNIQLLITKIKKVLLVNKT